MKFWYLQTTFRLFTWIARQFGDRNFWVSSRRHAGWPVTCPSCGHVGRLKDWSHEYEDDGEGDLEPVDYCPRCSDRL